MGKKKPAKPAAAFFDDTLKLGDSELKRLSTLAKQQLKQEKTVGKLTERLGKAQKELNRTSGELIPGLMQELGVESYTLASGEQVQVVTKVKASISKERQQKAFAWLRKHRHGSLIKNVVATAFGRGEEKDARAFVKELRKRGLVVDQKESVHPNTITAFVNEQLADGKKIPMDLLGVFEFSITKITKGKKRRPKGD